MVQRIAAGAAASWNLNKSQQTTGFSDPYARLRRLRKGFQPEDV